MNFETNIAEGIFTETEFPELNHTELNHTEFNELEAMSPFLNSEMETGFYSEISFSEYEAGKNNWSEAIRQNKIYSKSLGWDKETEKIRNYLKQYLGLTNVSFTDDIFAKSVYEWQSRIKAGLTADGVIGPRSWAVLKPLTQNIQPAPYVPPVNTPSRWKAIFKDTVLCTAEPLLHGSDAFKKMTEAIRTADSGSHYIYILGWMLDDDFEMVPGDPSTTLYSMLSRANDRGVEIRILIWNNFFYKTEIAAALDRINKLKNALIVRDNYTYGSAGLKIAISKMRYLVNSAPSLLNLLTSWKDFKDKLNIIQNEGSHHEKVVVVKGREGLIAFCGGIDINPDRVGGIDSSGKSVVLHDVHCMFRGYAAYVLLHRFKWRWQVLKESLYWMPDLKNCINEPVPGAIVKPDSSYVKILQTYNHPAKNIKDRSIRETVKIAIANARTSVHFEDQYMISLEIASWLNAKLKEPGFMKVSILTQDDSIAKSDIQFPKDMRKKFIDYLCRGLTTDQIRTKVSIQMLNPDTPALSHHKVHSKIYIIDDELAIIGSANCSSRSMTHDSETAAVIFNDPGTTGLASKLLTKMRNDPFKNAIPYVPNPKIKDKDVELTDDINSYIKQASIVTDILGPAIPVNLIFNQLIPALKPAFIDIIDPDADNTVPQQELSEEYELTPPAGSENFEFQSSNLNNSLNNYEYYENTDISESASVHDQENYDYAKYEDISEKVPENYKFTGTINNGYPNEIRNDYEGNEWINKSGGEVIDAYGKIMNFENPVNPNTNSIPSYRLDNLRYSGVQEWANRPEDLEIRKKVYERHVENSISSGNPFTYSLNKSQIKEVDSSGKYLQTEAADWLEKLLIDARAALKNNNVTIQIRSGYRTADEQFSNWVSSFPANFYWAVNSAGKDRNDIDGIARYIGARIAAPGFSNHNHGLAVDFHVQEGSKVFTINTNPKDDHKTYWINNSLFWKWLSQNAVRYHFYPYSAEPWHWEYKSPINTATDSGSVSVSQTSSSNIGSGNVNNDWSDAIRLNRYFGRTLGWENFADKINDLLLPYSGMQNVSLGEEAFAQTVSVWQSRNGFSSTDSDGIIGPKTWQKMRSLITGAVTQQTGSSKLPGWVKTLTPLLNKHRGDIPLEFLLGWIAVESYGKIDVTTSLNERGYFQIHPDESKMLKIADHNRLSTDPEFSVTSGISLIRNRGIQAGKIADSLGFAKGSDLYWHIVKLLHWLPGGVKIITDEMISQGFKPTDWEEFKNFVIRNQEKIKQTMRSRFGKVWDPLKGLANVDKLYNYSNQFRQNLQTNEIENEFQNEFEIQPDINYYDIPYFKNLKPDGVIKALSLIKKLVNPLSKANPWLLLYDFMKFAVTEFFNALQFGEQISCLKGISYAIVARTIGETVPQPSRNWPLSQQKAYIEGAAFVGNFIKKGLNISPYDGITAATKETDVNIVFGLLGAQLYKSRAGSPWYMIRSITGSLKWPKDNILLYELEEYKENVSEYGTENEYERYEFEQADILHTEDEMNYQDSYSSDEFSGTESFETIYEESENHSETIDEPDYNIKEDSNENYYFSESEMTNETNETNEANYYDNIAGSNTVKGSEIYETGSKHVGEQYIYGAFVPKNNSNWKGPWDCAEFASWCVFQASGKLYGCEDNSGNPATENAYTGYWGRDAKSLGKIISIEEAARTKGAAVLRLSTPSSATGHIVISDGKGGTVEAHSSSTGVIKSTLSNRRWDMGILVPGIQYEQGSSPVPITNPTSTIYRLTNPMMRGDAIKDIQIKLKARGFDPGAPDGVYGLKTYNAVRAFQMSAGLVVDGEAGPAVIKALSQNTTAPVQPSVPAYTPGGTSAPSVQNIPEFNKWHAQKILENMNSGVIGQYFDSKSQLEKIARGETVLNVNPQSRIVQMLPLIWHISEQAKINNYREIMIGSFIRDKSSDGSCTGHCEGRCIDINYKGGSFDSSGSVTMVINILRYLVSVTALYKKSMGFGMPLQGEFFGNKSLAKFKSQPASMLINSSLKQLVPQLGYVFPDNNNHLHIQVKWT